VAAVANPGGWRVKINWPAVLLGMGVFFPITFLEEILTMFVLLYLFYERIAGVSTSDLTQDQQVRDKG
jgi:hypothetical protein